MNGSGRKWLRGGLGRARLVWGIFAAVLIATGFAVYRLYDTVHREFEAQSQAAMAQELERLAARMQVRTETLRHATIKTLAGFHSEGLAHALRKWDEATPLVEAAIVWEETPGPVPLEERFNGADSILRRAGRPGRPPAAPGERPIFSEVFSLRDNPAFPPHELGYQAENLEMLAYAGRAAEPKAGWMVEDAAAGPWSWVFWYQPGAGAPVRYCVMNAEAVAASLRDEMSDPRLARVKLTATGRVGPGGPGTVRAKGMPGYVLAAEPGTLFAEKRNAALVSALAVVGLLGLCLCGAAALAIHAQREVGEAERKATFVTQVSHELRTPLTSIRVFADMLAAPEVAAEKRVKFAGSIGRESARLAALIDRLLTFNALERGKAATAVESVDVSAVVRETVEEMEAALQLVGLRMEVELPEGVVLAATDRGALKQALLNLLDNAAKYARGGGWVKIAVTAGEDVRVRVADGGPGVARELGERAFEPFVQGGQTLTDKTPGVGLGLTIARGLLRAAGGDLGLLASERGAVFEIRMPLAGTSTS